MDPRESGRGQVESGNPETKSRREWTGQTVAAVVVWENLRWWCGWAVAERVPQSNTAKTISDPQTLILIPFPFPVSPAGSEQSRAEQPNPNGNPNSEAWIWDERGEGRDGWRASTLVDAFFFILILLFWFNYGERERGEWSVMVVAMGMTLLFTSWHTHSWIGLRIRGITPHNPNSSSWLHRLCVPRCYHFSFFLLFAPP